MTGSGGYRTGPVRFRKDCEGIDILRQTRLTQDRSRDPADNNGRHLRVVQPLHQVGECGQQCCRDAINHPKPCKEGATDRELVECLSRVPARPQRGCATPLELTTGAAWCPWRCGVVQRALPL